MRPLGRNFISREFISSVLIICGLGCMVNMYVLQIISLFFKFKVRNSSDSQEEVSKVKADGEDEQMHPQSISGTDKVFTSNKYILSFSHTSHKWWS